MTCADQRLALHIHVQVQQRLCHFQVAKALNAVARVVLQALLHVSGFPPNMLDNLVDPVPLRPGVPSASKLHAIALKGCDSLIQSKTCCKIYLESRGQLLMGAAPLRSGMPLVSRRSTVALNADCCTAQHPALKVLPRFRGYMM